MRRVTTGSIATRLLRAEPIDAREFRSDLAAVLKRNKPRVITDRRMPRMILVPDRDMAELAETVEAMTRSKARKRIDRGGKRRGPLGRDRGARMDG